MHVLINAANVTGSGAETIAINLLPVLLRVNDEFLYTLLLPDKPSYRSLSINANAQVIYVSVGKGRMNNIKRIIQLYWGVPRLVKKIGADVCLTLGDIGPLKVSCPHVLFLQQALLLHSEDELKNFSVWSLPKRFYMQWHFANSAKRAAAIIVQTPVMAEKVVERYSFPPHKIAVIPQPVPQNIVNYLDDFSPYNSIAQCKKRIKLLFLASYYRNKNFEILPAVACELRRRSLGNDVQIFITLDETNDCSKQVRNEMNCFSDMITNLGPIPPQHIVRAFRSSTALFLPTLSESYGLIYLEAMVCGVPILTSDRNFSRWMCREFAHYFNPLDPVSIVDTICNFVSRANNEEYKTSMAARLKEFPLDWETVARPFLNVLRDSMQIPKCGVVNVDRL